MTNENTGYASANALRQAITDRAREAVKQSPSTSIEKRLRQFAYTRFLARVFHDVTGNWVLKGGVALLGRLPDARHSRDIDLARKSSSIDDVVDDLESLAHRDLGDFFEFRLGAGSQLLSDAHVGVSIPVVAYLGVKEFSRFGVDVVTDVNTTMDPETIEPHRPIDVEGLAEVPWRIYPLVDHMADKFAAMLEVHGDGKQTSSRYRDLVDLVLIASSERVDGPALRRAILTELRLRGIPVSSPLRVPRGEAWRAGYKTLSKELSGLHMTFEEACDVATELFSIVDGSNTGGMWIPESRIWSE